jgi:surface protein
MFEDNGSFNQDISGWDTGNVTNMRYMFYNSSLFDQPIGSWNISNVSDMTEMFNNAAAFNQNLSSWITTFTVFSEPVDFSLNANSSWIANRAAYFPRLSDGVTPIST